VYAGKCKPGPRKGHARELYDEVEQLEKSFNSLNSQLQEHLSPPGRSESHSLGQEKLPSGSYDGSLQSLNAAGISVQAAEAVKADENRILAVCSANTPRNRERVTAAVSHSGLLRAVAADAESHEYNGFLETAGLPPYHQLAALVDLYFEHVNAWLPLLEQESILGLLRNPLQLGEPDQILLHALVLTGSRYWKDLKTIRWQYHESSKQRIQLYVLKHSNIRGLQALAILTVDVLGDAHTVEGMNLLALLAQNFSHLGLGVENRFDLGLSIDAPAGLTQGSMLPHPTSWLQEEEARRLFWAVYSIDRYTNTCTSSNFMIDEREVNRPLPCRYNLWVAGEQVETRWYRTDKPFGVTADAPENLGSFSYLCEVTRIMTRIHEFAKQPLDFYSSSDIGRWRASYAELDRQLSSWLNSLPGEYAQITESCRSDTRSRVSNWITLQSGFILAAIRLHSVAGYPPMTSELFKASHSAMQKCITAVTSMMRTAQDVVSAGMLQLLGSPFAGALWVTARLLLVHASVPENHLDPSIYFFISTLERLGEHWPVAKVFSRRLVCMLPHTHMGDNAKSLEDLRR
jgi:hypothetical protein